ncbi:universal stress protein [Anaerobacillus sp. 1_MG-2023]|uniref:universal stress protein n=1 Tax=Bacillales TaxID=1385 RepID=UPI0026E242DE|nr:universal stress protein [Anaerobacillus sp. 1_MG-2023]MDO6654856.1 universal stress protein [Anaerobacillus sp. 1_MG-2023]
MYQQILLASDGSTDSVKAAEKAFELANLTGGHVEIVYVIDGETSKHDALRHADSSGLDMERREKLSSTEAIAEEANVSYDVTILHGSPSTTLIDHANETKSDLVVMGTRGLNVLQEMVIGSVSHQVIQKANCPVLVVK